MNVEEFFRKMKDKYSECFLPLSELSLDDAKKESLCYSARKCLGYDSLIKVIYKHKRFPASVDAISIGGGYLNFIEFKNCAINSKERCNIRQKIFEGLYIFEREILEKTFLVDLDMQTRFVLVYSDNLNRQETESQKELYDNLLDLAGISRVMPWEFNRFIGDCYHNNFHIFTTSMSVSDKVFISNLDDFVARNYE